MNRFAYLTTGAAIKTLSTLLKARIHLHHTERIPQGPTIFVLNHFTRLETLYMPYHIFNLTKVPVWSMASAELFKGVLPSFFDKVGVVSTKDPDRDRLVVRSLLTGEAHWIIFPEGRMVKSKQIFEKGRFMISYAGGKRPPHTGAAALALRTEFYRRRLAHLMTANPQEAQRLAEEFNLSDPETVINRQTYLVPVNITYYPIRARENILSNLAKKAMEHPSELVLEELMAEGTMLLSGVDMDVRFGEPIEVGPYLAHKRIRRDITNTRQIDMDAPIASRQILRKQAVRLMQRYMAAIYGMTTINHDHLLASLLRWTPMKRIGVFDLSARIYLLITQYASHSDLYRHNSLKADQLNLLTDDRFRKMHEFIELALEKKILRREGDCLLRVDNIVTAAIDYHRARVDHPLAVIANEVLPLRDLQKAIRRMAWTPRFWVRRKLVKLLRQKAHQTFDKDYVTNYIAGESKPPDVGRPFLLKGDLRRIGVVLVHGYMAAPLEMEPLARYLADRGYWVYVPRVAGHGTAPEDLGRQTYETWIDSVELGYAIIRSLCDQVVMGGFSNGAGLALELTSRCDAVAAVFAVCPPLRLQDISSRFAPAVDVWNKFMKRMKLQDAQKEFVENHPENPHINYTRNPIAGVRQLERLMDMVEPKLKTIQAPSLVVQAYQDPVVNPKGSLKVYNRIGAKDKRYVVFNYDRHGILLGDDVGQVYNVIGDFVAESCGTY